MATPVSPYVSPGLVRNAAGKLVRSPAVIAMQRAQSAKPPVVQPAQRTVDRGPSNPHYTRYLTEYQDPNTAAERRAQIDKVYNFGSNPKTAYSAPAPAAPPPTVAQPAPPVATPPAVADPAPAPTPVFKSIYDFIPTDYKADPTYKYQVDQGTRALERLYAKRGLTGSGAEITGNSNFLNELGANASQRALGTATTDASRYDSQGINESNAARAAGQDQWSRLMDLIGEADKQNPFTQGVNAINSTVGLTTDKSNALANFLKGNYSKTYASGGQSTALPPLFVPPAASGPDTTLSSLYNAINSGSTNSDILNLGTQGVSSLINLLR